MSVKSDEEFNWKAFQKHNKLTDEELEVFRGDPKRNRVARKLFTEDIKKKLLVFEVTHSHGCSCGMKPGDRLVFKNMTILDPTRSSPWCAQAFVGIEAFANMAQDRYCSDLDPNDMLWDMYSCEDVGPMHGGWGRVHIKCYVCDEGDLGD